MNKVIVDGTAAIMLAVADCGIGQNRLGEQPDWTFMANADQYKTRRLTVFVR